MNYTTSQQDRNKLRAQMGSGSQGHVHTFKEAAKAPGVSPGTDALTRKRIRGRIYILWHEQEWGRDTVRGSVQQLKPVTVDCGNKDTEVMGDQVVWAEHNDKIML